MDTLHSGDEDDEEEIKQTNLIPPPQKVTFDFKNHSSQSQVSTPIDLNGGHPD